jgi:hypothetical protein
VGDGGEGVWVEWAGRQPDRTMVAKLFAK